VGLLLDIWIQDGSAGRRAAEKRNPPSAELQVIDRGAKEQSKKSKKDSRGMPYSPEE
jgi:hypothetical protein